MDLMDMVKGAISKQVMGQLGGMLGTDEKKTSSVFETATGSILGGLIKKAGTPQGAKDVFDMAQKQDASVLDKLGDLMGGGQATDDFQKNGGVILDGVFGAQSQSGGVIEMIAKFLGLDNGLMGTAMKMLAPIVMGVIGKHIKSKALDAAGLGNFLGEQKKSLSFMPSSLTEGLGFGNLLSGVGDAGKAAMGAAAGAAGVAGNAGKAAVGVASDAAESGFNFIKLLLPLIIFAALAFAAWKFLAPAAKDGIDKAGSAVSGAVDDMKNAAGSLEMPTIPGIDIPEDVDFGDFGAKGLSGLNDQFTGITDGFKNVTADNAGGLANKIKGLTGSIDGMGLANLPESGKGIVGTMISKFVDAIKASMGGIGDDGILGTLKPVVEGLMQKLTPLM